MDKIETNEIETYGVGVEWSFAMEGTFKKNFDKFECIELIPENFFRQGQKFLEALAATNLPTAIHGVELSIGSHEPLKQDHLDKFKPVIEAVNCFELSEHLSMTESGGVEIGQLTPLNWSTALADHISRKIEQVQAQIDVPFAIENVTNRFLIPDTELSETDFINAILRKTGCGLLIDLNNIDTNAYNYGYDPYEWLEAINLNCVTGVHLAGGVFDDEGTLQDSHNAPVRNRVWDMYEWLLQRVIPRMTIVEWTDDCPGLDVMLKDVNQARGILNKRLAELPPRAADASKVSYGSDLHKTQPQGSLEVSP